MGNEGGCVFRGKHAGCQVQSSRCCGELLAIPTDLFDLSQVHSDSVRRGGGQVVPAVRRVIHAACLLAEPALMEPVYLGGYCPLFLSGDC
jgi:hypothetical protein